MLKLKKNSCAKRLTIILPFLKVLLSHRILWLTENTAAGVGQDRKVVGRYFGSVCVQQIKKYISADGAYGEVSRVGLPNFIETH